MSESHPHDFNSRASAGSLKAGRGTSSASRRDAAGGGFTQTTLRGPQGWLLFEKLRQVDAQAVEHSGFDSVALGTDLCDLEHTVPEL